MYSPSSPWLVYLKVALAGTTACAEEIEITKSNEIGNHVQTSGTLFLKLDCEPLKTMIRLSLEAIIHPRFEGSNSGLVECLL